MKIFRVLTYALMLIGIVLFILHFTNDLEMIYGLLLVVVGTILNTIFIFKDKKEKKLSK